MNTPQQPGGPGRTSAPSTSSKTTAQPNGNTDGRRAFRMAIVVAVAALVAVIGFNLMAPKNRLQAPGEGSSTPSSQGAQQTGGSPGGTADTPQAAAPQRADTPTAPGRESVGAPVGSTPQSPSPAPAPAAPQ